MQKIIIIVLALISTQAMAEKFFYKENFLTYYTTHKFDKTNSKVNRLVIVVHGALRNGDDYFRDTVVAAKKHQVEKSTMIVAPHFRKVTDTREIGEIYYGRKWYTKWKYGYVSQDSDKVSSFTLIDTMIKRISDSGRFPNLKNIVITGHSAGGQFTQRYSVGSRIASDINADVEFVPSNPSSYMYLDQERFHFSDGNFELQSEPENCDEYNEYIYGPINRAKYLARYSVEGLKSIFKNNKVIYLMSEQDKGTDSLDRSCEAMLQGKNRFERAKNFWHYDKKLLKGSSFHQFIGIPDIGHEHVDVYESSEAGQVIFGLKSKSDSSYLYRKIGNSSDVVKKSNELYLLLGGGKNELKGFSTFLKAANGGDVLVISGKAELNHRYTFDLWNMAEEKGIGIDSVETISFLNRNAGSHNFIIDKINKAEAIFFTGGNQAKYVQRIKDTPAHAAILKKVKAGIPIGGTSAGLAIMGEFIFSAKEGGLSSRYVLRNPHAKEITIEKGFFGSELLKNLITDTHFINRDREGRLLGFMFRTQFDFRLKTLYGVGIDEQSSLVISKNGMVSKGGVSFYKSTRKSAPTRQSSRLNFGPLNRLKLQNNITLPHFSLLNFREGDTVSAINGEVVE